MEVATVETSNLMVVREIIEPCRIKLNIAVPVERVKAIFEKTQKEFGKFGKVPGFRPGKSPRDLVLRHYGKTIREEAKKELLKTAADEAIKQEKLEAETTPRLENPEKLEFVETTAFTFSISFDVTPTFTVPDYKNLNLVRPAITVDESSVNQAISGLLERRATFEKVEREAQAGDLLKVNYHGTLSESGLVLPDNVKFLLDGQGTWLPLRKPEIIPGATVALVGAKPGAEVTFPVCFPEDFFEKTLVGKNADFTVTVLEVHATQTPALTDDLARQMGAKDAADMKDRVKTMLSTQETRRQDETLRQQILEVVLNLPDFAMPPSLLSRQTLQDFLHTYEAELRKGRKEDEVKAEQEQMMEKSKNASRIQMKRYYVLRAIAEQEKISVDPQEVMAVVEHLAKTQNLSPKVAQRRLADSGGLEDIFVHLRESKTLDRILALSRVMNQPAAT